MDDGWRPVKQYIEETMKVPTDREQVYFEDWDEAALRQIIRQQRKITETSKQLKMKQLYQILILVVDFADSPHLHKKTGDADSEGPDKAFRRDGFDGPRPPHATQSSSSVSGRWGEAVLRGGEAIVVAGDPISEPFQPRFGPDPTCT